MSDSLSSKYAFSKKFLLIISFILCVVILLPLLGPLVENKPIVSAARSKRHTLTLPEIAKNDPYLFNMLSSLKEAPEESTRSFLELYLNRYAYADFFQANRVDLSDQYVWSLFLKNNQQSNIPMDKVEEQIKKQYGSKKAFLQALKPHFLQSFLNQSIADLSFSSSQSSINQIAAQAVRHVDVYSFDIDSHLKDFAHPAQAQLKEYYDTHQEKFYSQPSISFNAVVIGCADLDYEKARSAYQEELKALGYAEIDEAILKDYAAYKKFVSLEETLDENASLEAIVPILKQGGFEMVNPLIQHKDCEQGYFAALLDDQELARQVFDQAQSFIAAGIKSLPHPKGRMLVQVKEFNLGALRPFEETASLVFKAWQRDHALADAQNRAKNILDAALTHQEIQSKMADRKEQLAIKIDSYKSLDYKLYEQALSLDSNRRPAALLADPEADVIRVVVLDKLTFPAAMMGEKPLQTDGLEAQQQRFDSLYQQAFQSQLLKEYGYTLTPEFLKLLQQKEARA